MDEEDEDEGHIGLDIERALHLVAGRKVPGFVRLIKLETKRPTNKPTAANLWAKYEAWDTLPNVIPGEGQRCAFANARDFSRHMPAWRITRFLSRVNVCRFVVIEVPVENVEFRDEQALFTGGRTVYATI